MAISNDQKIDYLFKKVGFGTTKTDTNANKLAANEVIPSPLLLEAIKYGNRLVAFRLLSLVQYKCSNSIWFQ